MISFSAIWNNKSSSRSSRNLDSRGTMSVDESPIVVRVAVAERIMTTEVLHHFMTDPPIITISGNIKSTIF